MSNKIVVDPDNFVVKTSFVDIAFIDDIFQYCRKARQNIFIGLN